MTNRIDKTYIVKRQNLGYDVVVQPQELISGHAPPTYYADINLTLAQAKTLAHKVLGRPFDRQTYFAMATLYHGDKIIAEFNGG